VDAHTSERIRNKARDAVVAAKAFRTSAEQYPNRREVAARVTEARIEREHRQALAQG
jgi:hypothetical protein